MKPYCIQLAPLRMYTRNSAAASFSATLRFPTRKKIRQRGERSSGLEQSGMYFVGQAARPGPPTRAVFAWWGGKPINSAERQYQAPDNFLIEPNA